MDLVAQSHNDLGRVGLMSLFNVHLTAIYLADMEFVIVDQAVTGFVGRPQVELVDIADIDPTNLDLATFRLVGLATMDRVS